MMEPFVVLDAQTLTKGQLLNLNVATGEVDGGATTDTTLAGVAAHDVDNTDDGEVVRVYSSRETVFGVVDANARVAGAKLDIAAGGLTLAAASNNDLVVVRDSAADEETLVTYNGTHYIKS